MSKLTVASTCAAIALLFGNTAGAQVREADVTGGHVAGAVANGIASFKGIPFAAPPVGALRWKAPQPVTPWTGGRQATTFGPSCMQDADVRRASSAHPRA